MSDKLKHKLRASEAARVKTVRELEQLRKYAKELAQRLYEKEERVKELERQAEIERDARIETEAGWMEAVRDLQAEVERLRAGPDAPCPHCNGTKRVETECGEIICPACKEKSQ